MCHICNPTIRQDTDMITKITPYKVDDKTGELVAIPLDDADSEVIELVRKIVGKPSPHNPSGRRNPNGDR